MPKRTVRRCSFCHEPGHTKRHCVEAERERNVKKKKTLEKPVIVRVVHDGRTSPHVVNLKPEEIKREIQVQAFREKYQKMHTAPQTIDLAAVVRAANTNKLRKDALHQAHEAYKKEQRALEAEEVMRKKKEDSVPHPSIQPEVHHTKRMLSPALIPEKKQRIRFSFPSVSLPRVSFAQVSIKKFTLTFVAALVLITLPFPTVGYYKKVQQTQNDVINHSTNAFFALQSSTIAALQSDLSHAQQDLNTALEAFSAAQSMVDREHTVLQYVASLVPALGDQVRSRQHVLLAGHHLALGNTYLVKGVDAATKDPNANLTDRMNILRAHLRSAMPQYQKALEDLGRVDQKAIPVEYQESFGEFKLLFAAFIDDMQDLTDLVDIMNAVFGAEDFKRYLLVFQNHHEIRPTGGFMGSFAVLDVQKGKIEKVDVAPGGTYDLQGQLDVYVKPPVPLQLVNGRWEFQDANWFPDFAAAAQKMEWFYEHGRKTTVDGVIAVNASVLERFLRVIGPVTSSPKYDLLLSADTALTQIQEVVETGPDKKIQQPKLIIASLLDQFLGGIGDVSKVELLRLLSEVHEAAERKEIQVYMNDAPLQNKLRTFGWTGEIAQTQGAQDYLMLVNANLQGQKSDAKIKQDIYYTVTVQDDGSMIAHARVKRSHTGIPNETFYGGMNVNYVRLFVPDGAELLEATGFTHPPDRLFRAPEAWYVEDPDLVKREQEIGMHAETGTRVTREFGKTVFGNWMMVEPGKETEATFTYKLPFRVVVEDEKPERGFELWKQKILASHSKPSRYSLLLQKQSGVESAVHVTVHYPENWSPVWKLHEQTLLQQHSAMYEGVLSTDTAFGVVMEKK